MPGARKAPKPSADHGPEGGVLARGRTVAGKRAEIVGARERAAASREAASRSREDASGLREGAAAVREGAVVLREQAAGLREESSTRLEASLRSREEATQGMGDLEQLMEQIREANERLIVGAVRAQTQTEEAEHANHIKDEFLATVSHELRTPLNAILGWARLLRSTQYPPDQVERGFTVIERNATALAHLIDDLLDLSRIVAGTLRLAAKPVEIVATTHAALETVRPLAAARSVDLEVVPGVLTATIVRGDATRLQQVLWNLLANAIKFTPAGGRVKVHIESPEEHVEIRVVDSGQGIHLDFLPHVFDRFRQADGTTTRRHSGLGIGLAIVRQIVELHGGTVHAASPGVGLGSTFTVRLPIATVEAAASPPGRARGARGREPADGPPGARPAARRAPPPGRR